MILEIERELALEDAAYEPLLHLMQRAANAAEQMEHTECPLSAHIVLTDNEKIRALNKEFRATDRATDVLSFPTVQYAKNHTAGTSPKRLSREYDDETNACFLGDIVISIPRAREQASEYGHSEQREIAYLLVHGLFHLMGYDHMEEEEKRRMRAMEEKTLDSIGIGRITEDELVALAKEAMKNSYSPYSKFRVGACLLAKSGRVYQGCNIENASYGATNCAERTALFKAVSEGEREFVTIAIAAEKSMAWPCGICRQALNEFAPHIKVIVACGEQRSSTTLDQLLPNSFGPLSGTLEILGRE